jgi:uncharacterized damage-inducible protein DinB
MKQSLVHFGAYNHWANRVLCDAVLSLREGLPERIVASSFPNLYGTLLHIWDAESGWWQTLEGHSTYVIPSEQFNPNLRELINGLLNQSALWERYAATASEEELNRRLACRHAAGGNYEATAADILLHVVNHSSYHRGQLINIMRQLGEAQVPNSDFSTWLLLQQD